MATPIVTKNPTRGRSLLAVVAVPLVVTACLSGDLDSLPDAPNVDALPVLTLEEFVRIGSVDDPDYGFSRPGGLEVDTDGNLYVLELQDLEIRVYSPDGTLLRSFGGEGEGPGELGGASLRFGVHGDSVWVFDQALERLTLFDRGGRVLSASRVERVSDTLYVAGQWVRLVPGHRVGPWMFMGAPGEGLEMLESRAEDTAAARRTILREMPFPPYQNPVQATFQTTGGALWLRREEMGGERVRYTVLDPDDVPVGELEIPRTSRPGWSDGEILWAIEPDELQVPWVVGYRIVGGG